MKKILMACALSLIAVGVTGAMTYASSQNDDCCCVTTDSGALLCTVTGEIQEACCCE